MFEYNFLGRGEKGANWLPSRFRVKKLEFNDLRFKTSLTSPTLIAVLDTTFWGMVTKNWKMKIKSKMEATKRDSHK